MKYSLYCFTHDPATSVAHAQATGKGGKVTKADRLLRAVNKLPKTAERHVFESRSANG